MTADARKIAPVSWRRRLCRIAGMLAAVWLLLCVAAAAFYPCLLYHPDRTHPAVNPGTFGVDYEEFWLAAPDGARLHGWHLPGSPEGGKRRTLLVFHGNAGNLATAVHRLVMYSRMGCDVYMIDYHGYGASGGAPGEANLYLDSDLVWDYVTGERGARPDEIIILGYSLGGAVAARLAERRPEVAGLILESTFTRLSDVAGDLFPMFPCRLILGNAYNTMERLPGLGIPLMVIHGEGDELVPYKYGRRIFESYRGPKRFLRIGDDHNLGFLAKGDVYAEGIRAFLPVAFGE